MILDDSIKAAKSTGTILNSKPTVNVVSLCHRGVHLLTSCMGDIDSKKKLSSGDILYIYIYYILYQSFWEKPGTICIYLLPFHTIC